MDLDEDDANGLLPTCSVCLRAFNTTNHIPIDIGCHSFCQTCVDQHPEGFRQCPECRAVPRNPHVNVALLRMVSQVLATRTPGGAAGPTLKALQCSLTTAGVLRSQLALQPMSQKLGLAAREQAYSVQQRQRPTTRPAALLSQQAQANSIGAMQGLTGFSHALLTDAAAFMHSHVLPLVQASLPASSSSANSSVHRTPTTRNGSVVSAPQNASPIISRATAVAGRSNGGVQHLRQQQQQPVELPASFLFLSQSTWMALGLLIYILSPLDLIPDFLPVVGWLDDAVALFYFLKLVLSQISQ